MKKLLIVSLLALSISPAFADGAEKNAAMAQGSAGNVAQTQSNSSTATSPAAKAERKSLEDSPAAHAEAGAGSQE